MISFNKKGSILLKILSAAAILLLWFSIETPRSMWLEQKEREEIAQNRMISMSELETIYMQETGHFSENVKDLYNYAVDFDTLLVGAPELELEIMTLDTSKIRISFNDYDRVEDLNVVRADGAKLKAIESNTVKANETLYNVGNEITVSLKMKDKNLNLHSHQIKINSTSSIEAVAKYKGDKDIYWDFAAKNGKLTFEKVIIPEYEEQRVNMARYILNDFDHDKTPYLCPSTNEPFRVTFNLNAKIYLKINFFKGDNKDESLMNQTVLNITDNEKVKNYFLNIANLKAERKVSDLVREYEMDADSTYSKQEAKDSLFAAYFKEYLKTSAIKEAVTDSISKSLSATNLDQDIKFSEEKRFNTLFALNLAEKVTKQLDDQENINYLNTIKCVYKTGIVNIDTVSVKIESPINEKSVFKGYQRTLLQKYFGVEDDQNHGFVDNNRPSWKKE